MRHQDFQPDIEPCELCAQDFEHHTNSMTSIGGGLDRHVIWDLHVVKGGALAECTAPRAARQRKEAR